VSVNGNYYFTNHSLGFKTVIEMKTIIEGMFEYRTSNIFGQIIIK